MENEKDTGEKKKEGRELPKVLGDLLADQPTMLAELLDAEKCSDEELADLADRAEIVQSSIRVRRQTVALAVFLVLANLALLPVAFMSIVRRFFPETAAKVEQVRQDRENLIDKK